MVMPAFLDRKDRGSLGSSTPCLTTLPDESRVATEAGIGPPLSSYSFLTEKTRLGPRRE